MKMENIVALTIVARCYGHGEIDTWAYMWAAKREDRSDCSSEVFLQCKSLAERWDGQRAVTFSIVAIVNGSIHTIHTGNDEWLRFSINDFMQIVWESLR